MLNKLRRLIGAIIFFFIYDYIAELAVRLGNSYIVVVKQEDIKTYSELPSGNQEEPLVS